MGNSAKRDERASKRAELQRKALELRKAGATYDQIATQLKLKDRSASWKLIRAALNAIIKEPAEDVLRLELERLDAMLLGLWTSAKSGDTQVVSAVLRIMDRRASYLGIDAPKAQHIEVATTGSGTLDPNNPTAVAQRLRQMFGERATTTDATTDATETTNAPPSDPSVADSAGEVPERAPEE